MKTFKQFMNEENPIITTINRFANPIRRLVGAETPPLPQGTKEVNYSKFPEIVDKTMAGFGGADPAKKNIASNKVPSGKIQDRVPETPTRDMPPEPQDSTKLETQMRFQTKLKKMRGY